MEKKEEATRMQIILRQPEVRVNPAGQVNSHMPSRIMPQERV